ncbi:hypothetical protein HOC76_01660, partial [bacterium]|nr:hypothetical protein [bacterium]
MKIIVCGSMKISEKMVEAKRSLEGSGHQVLIPRFAEEYAKGKKQEESSSESIENKIEGDLIRDYYHQIEKGDVLLVVNEKLRKIDSYIGGNTFLEMGFAHVLGKKIFLLNGIPDISYKAEIIAMQP